MSPRRRNAGELFSRGRKGIEKKRRDKMKSPPYVPRAFHGVFSVISLMPTPTIPRRRSGMIHIFGFPWLRRIRSGEEKKQELGMVMMTRRGDKVGMRQGIPRYYFLHLFCLIWENSTIFLKNKLSFVLANPSNCIATQRSSNTYPNLLSPSSFIHTLLGAKYKGREGVVCGDSK